MFTSKRGHHAFLSRTRVELHFHLLPDVDDGPSTLNDALALGRLAMADGTGLVICTPHAELVDVCSLPDRVGELRAALQAERIPLQVRCGGEIRAGTPLCAAELEIVAQGPPGHRWLLLEAPLEPNRIEVFHAHADELESRGYGLVIAHPERCAALMAPGGGLENRLRRGAELQVNASSLTGDHDAASADAGFDLLARGLGAGVASDAHGVHRPPLMTMAARLLAARGLDAAAIVDEGPWRLAREGVAPRRGRRAV